MAKAMGDHSSLIQSFNARLKAVLFRGGGYNNVDTVIVEPQ